MLENNDYLTKQIITYLGNKRCLLNEINKHVIFILKDLKINKITFFDVFAGSGIVSRFMKQYSSVIYANDLENYCKTINECYLANKDNIDMNKLNYYFNQVKKNIDEKGLKSDGFIYNLYTPKDDKDIKKNERVFFTTRNGKYIDTARYYIKKVPDPYKTLLLGPLLYEVSTKNNTGGVFKGFYKNSKTKLGQYGGNSKAALKRILSDIELSLPVLSNFNCDVKVLQGNANDICKEVPHVNLAYIDPPYNQHPYGSNYFMLNLVNDYKEPSNISKISGIPSDWNRSFYNKAQFAKVEFDKLIKNIKADYVLISYNSEGIILFEEMIKILKKYGKITVNEIKYNTYKASRNLKTRSIYVYEYLILLKKE